MLVQTLGVCRHKSSRHFRGHLSDAPLVSPVALSYSGTSMRISALTDLEDEYNNFSELLRELQGKPKFIPMDFCPECNNMLYPKEGINGDGEKVLLYYCRNCDHEQEANDPCIYINRITHDVDSLALVSEDLKTDPSLARTTDTVCPSCDKYEAVQFQSLADRDKSAMRLYYVCVPCGHKWAGKKEVEQVL